MTKPKNFYSKPTDYVTRKVMDRHTDKCSLRASLASDKRSQLKAEIRALRTVVDALSTQVNLIGEVIKEQG